MRSFASFLWILGEWVHCRINEFRISFIIERVIVGHRCKPWSCTFKASKRTYGINSYVLLFVLMLSPTILSINWFFSFILLRRLEGIQRNSQASCSGNTMVQRIFLYFFEKTRGSGFWAILICFVDTIRIRGRTLSPESLDWYAARDSERVVRTYQEMDVRPVSLSSTTEHPKNGMREKALIGDGEFNFRMWVFAVRNRPLD